MASTRGVRSLLQAVIFVSTVVFLFVGFGYFQRGYDITQFVSSESSLPSTRILASSAVSSVEPSVDAVIASPDVLSTSPPAVPSTFSTAPSSPTSDISSTPTKTPVAGKPKKKPPPSDAPPRVQDAVLMEQAPPYIDAIMDPDDDVIPRLQCPPLDTDRYLYLREQADSDGLPKWFFALDLYQCRHLLPRLLGSIIETIRLLGPENCVLSIVEGRSADGTFEVLEQLRTQLELLKVRYFLQTSDLNPKAKGTDRIVALAELRNLAMKDLMDNPQNYAKDTTVIFSNDIAPCAEDILELIHQRAWQGADQTCAMDWTYAGENPTFYDVWIARGMNGDLFFEIPPNGSWENAWNLFWNDDKTRARFDAMKPFQVFSCWNGITAFTAKPIMEKTIKFRGHVKGECFQGEPKLFDKDFWYHGFGKIAVVPSINVEYSDDAARRIKELKGFTSDNIKNEGKDHKIKWDPKPPELVKCMPEHKRQKFIPWNEALPLKTDGGHRKRA